MNFDIGRRSAECLSFKAFESVPDQRPVLTQGGRPSTEPADAVANIKEQ
jgi:hypothetical protein